MQQQHNTWQQQIWGQAPRPAPPEVSAPSMAIPSTVRQRLFTPADTSLGFFRSAAEAPHRPEKSGESSIARARASEAGLQRPIYFTSHLLKDAEIRYTTLEKLALALVMIARRLMAYFLSHPITVITNSALGRVLTNPEVSG